MDEIVGKVTRAFWGRFKRDRRYMHQDVVDRINDAVASSMTTHITALEAAGWRVVPVEPTEEMVEAGCIAKNLTTPIQTVHPKYPEAAIKAGYKTMLDAAPKLTERRRAKEPGDG